MKSYNASSIRTSDLGSIQDVFIYEVCSYNNYLSMLISFAYKCLIQLITITM